MSKKSICVGSTCKGIDHAAINRAIAAGCNSVAIVHNGSYHDSWHTFYAQKRNNGKIANIKNYVQSVYDRSIAADCKYYDASRDNYVY